MKKPARSWGACASARIIARTNKATLYQDVDGSIAKQYHTIDAVERILQDERSLGHLWNALANGRDADGWRYTVARPLRVDPASRTIWLELAPGQAPLTLATGALLDAEYHVGIWLATYHNRLLGEADEGVIFADASVHNIFVDPVGKVVTGFDPGSNWGNVGSRYQDVICHAYSLIVALLQRRRGPLRAVRSFLHGYGSATGVRMTPRAYAVALGRQARRQWIQYGKSKPKQFAFAAGSLLLAPLFTIYVPGVLARATNAGRRRSGKKGIAET
jgi:hypothetical protein